MSISKKTLVFSAFALLFCLVAFPAFAQDAEAAKAALTVPDSIFNFGKFIGAALAIGIAACGCGIGQGLAAKGALEGISRNPSAYKSIFTPMILALALIESLSIYGLLVSLLVLFR